MRRINQNTISYIIFSATLFLAASYWLITLNEGRIEVYSCALVLGLLVSDIVFNLKNRWLFIVELSAFAICIYFLIVDILNILVSSGVHIV